MKLLALMVAMPKFFSKENELNDLQLEITVNDSGASNYIDEEDFDSTTLKDIINKCLFDTTKCPITVCIKEWD